MCWRYMMRDPPPPPPSTRSPPPRHLGLPPSPPPPPILGAVASNTPPLLAAEAHPPPHPTLNPPKLDADGDSQTELSRKRRDSHVRERGRCLVAGNETNPNGEDTGRAREGEQGPRAHACGGSVTRNRANAKKIDRQVQQRPSAA